MIRRRHAAATPRMEDFQLARRESDNAVFWKRKTRNYSSFTEESLGRLLNQIKLDRTEALPGRSHNKSLGRGGVKNPRNLI